jgi:hypothetical protein
MDGWASHRKQMGRKANNNETKTRTKKELTEPKRPITYVTFLLRNHGNLYLFLVLPPNGMKYLLFDCLVFCSAFKKQTTKTKY